MPLEQPEETRVQYVMRSVAEHIGRERLRVGDELPGETSFGARLGVSRPVVREAFGALSALNIIDTRNGRRPRVSALNSRALSIPLDHAIRTEQISAAQVWETRRCLETQLIALAALRRTDPEARRIRELAGAMAAAERGSPELISLDIALHKAIATASRNVLMASLLASLEPLLEAAVPAAWRTRRTDEEHALVIARHLDLADSILQGDPEAARRAMEAHFDRAIGALLAETG
ncbi:MAG: FadR family transcriptional regulator [Caulobacteraceae bacterium]|nr:MAG: FadR family transcriptional regulator [Caulobacteraceae bacterium]